MCYRKPRKERERTNNKINRIVNDHDNIIAPFVNRHHACMPMPIQLPGHFGTWSTTTPSLLNRCLIIPNIIILYYHDHTAVLACMYLDAGQPLKVSND